MEKKEEEEEEEEFVYVSVGVVADKNIYIRKSSNCCRRLIETARSQPSRSSSFFKQQQK